jgi:hypothetical protein
MITWIEQKSTFLIKKNFYESQNIIQFTFIINSVIIVKLN